MVVCQYLPGQSQNQLDRFGLSSCVRPLSLRPSSFPKVASFLGILGKDFKATVCAFSLAHSAFFHSFLACSGSHVKHQCCVMGRSFGRCNLCFLTFTPFFLPLFLFFLSFNPLLWLADLIESWSRPSHVPLPTPHSSHSAFVLGLIRELPRNEPQLPTFILSMDPVLCSLFSPPAFSLCSALPDPTARRNISKCFCLFFPFSLLISLTIPSLYLNNTTGK